MREIIVTGPKISYSGGVSQFLSNLPRNREGISFIEFELNSSLGRMKGLWQSLKYIVALCSEIGFSNKNAIVVFNTSFQINSLIRDSMTSLVLRLFTVEYVILVHGFNHELFQRKNITRSSSFFFNGAKKIYVLSTTIERLFLNKFTIKDIGRFSTCNRFDFAGERPEGMNIIYVGRIIREKGVEDIINVAELAKRQGKGHWKFQIAGDGRDFELMKSICKERALDNVTFKGNLNDADLEQLYRSANVFLFPSSHAEGLPTVLLEALCCGLSLVTTPCEGFSELFSDEMGYLLSKDFSIHEIFRKLELVEVSGTIPVDKVEEYKRRFSCENLGNRLLNDIVKL